MLEKYFKKFNKLISQMAGTFKQQPTLANKLLNCQNGTLFSGNSLKKILKNDKNINNQILKYDNVSLKVLKYDNNFKNEVITETLKSLMKQYFTDNEKLISWINYFIKENRTDSASLDLFKQTQNGAIFTLYLNTNPFRRATQKIIYHELTHLFQGFDKDHQITSKTLSQHNENILKQHKIIKDHSDIQYVKYLLNEKQIIPHINDLCYQLKKLKNESKKYSQLKNSEFIDLLFNTLKQKYPMQSEFYIDLMNNSYQQSQLLTFYLTFYLEIQFERIKKIILDDFKDQQK